MYRRKHMEKNKFSIMVKILSILLTSCSYIYSYKVTINDNNLNIYDTNYNIIYKDSIIISSGDTLTEWNYKKYNKK